MAYALQRFDEGDILLFRGIPRHYAVYAGADQIIHYQPNMSRKAAVIKQSIQSYWENEAASSLKCTMRFPVKKSKLGWVDEAIVPKVYSGPEVVNRAQSLVDRKHYNLVLENCEHFVTWCKYDVKLSDQVEEAAACTLAGMGGTGGGAAGAILGSMFFPGVGTAVGGVIGAAVGSAVGGIGGWLGSKVVRIRRVKADNGGLKDQFVQV